MTAWVSGAFAAAIGILTTFGLLLAARKRMVLFILAFGTIVQSFVVGVLVVPMVGTSGTYLLLWKEAVIALAGLALWLNRQTRDPVERWPTGLKAILAVTAIQIAVYLIWPPSNHVQSSIATRLAGARQWLVPVELMWLGYLLARAGLPARVLLRSAIAYGSVIGCISILAWVFTPITFWAKINAAVQLLQDSQAQTRVEGLQSFYFGTAIDRAVAPFGSPLTLAFALVAPICCAWASNRRLTSPAMWIPIAALALTQTRAVALALIVVLAITAIAKMNLRMQLALFGVSAIAFVSDGIRTAIRNTVTLTDPSSRAHYDAIELGLSRIGSNILGFGLGEGGYVGRALGSGAAGGENLYLVAGNERGWLGVGLTVGLFVAAGLACYKRGQGEGSAAVLARASTAAISVLAIASLTTEHAVAFTSTWLLWLIVGFGLTAANRTEVDANDTSGRERLGNMAE